MRARLLGRAVSRDDYGYALRQERLEGARCNHPALKECELRERRGRRNVWEMRNFDSIFIERQASK